MKIERITWHDSFSADKTTVGVVVSSTKSEVILASTVEKTGKHSYTTSSVIKINTKDITSRSVLVKDGWFSHDSVSYVPVVEMTVVQKKTKKSSKKVSKSKKSSVINVPVTKKTSYKGPFKGKFDVETFSKDMSRLSIAQLARKHKMSWTTAKLVVKYLSPAKRGRQPKVSDAEFIKAYKEHTYTEIAKLLNISKATIGNRAKALADKGLLQYKKSQKVK